MAARRTPAALLTLTMLTLTLTPPPSHTQDLKLTGRAMEMAKKIDERCREETGAPRESLQHYIHGMLDDNQVFKCYLKCLMVELQSLSHHGDFAVEEELLNVPPEILEEGHRMVMACQDTKGADPCDTAFQMHRCYNSTNPELYKRGFLAFDMEIDS